MNREQLEEIRARASKASEGPWEADGWEVYGPIRRWVAETHDPDNIEQCEADAAFIANARTAVPALLDEIDRLREQLRLANRAKAHLFARIIASSHLLEKPFTNAPDQSPWTKVSFAMSALTEALTTAEGSAEGGTSKDSGGVS